MLKKLFAGWKQFELIWLGTFSGIAVALSLVSGDTGIGFTAFLFGVICVVLTAKGSIWSFVFGYVNTVLYGYISYRNGLYGEMWLNFGFFLPTGIIGLVLWKRNIRQAGHLVMRKLPWSRIAAIAAICLAGIGGMGAGLSLIATQNTPYIDATTNVLSIVATFLTLWRFREQWLVYLALNLFTILMWSIRCYHGSPDAALMLVMWSAYLVNAGYGYYNWSKGAKMREAA